MEGEGSMTTMGLDDDDVYDEHISLNTPMEESALPVPASPEEESDHRLYTRPIVVGYAFGPKKMSTMGVVMAEASKAKLSTKAAYYMMASDAPDYAPPPSQQQQQPGEVSNTNTATNFLTESSLLSHQGRGAEEPSSFSPSAYYNNQDVSNTSNNISNCSPGDAAAAVMVSTSAISSHLNNNNNNNNIVFTIDNKDGVDGDGSLRNIVRHFRSSCSSVGSVSTGLTVPSTVTLSAATIASGGGDATTSMMPSNKLVPVGVSFVPLDPGK